MTHPPSPLANFSPERRATALSWIRGEGLLDAPISDDARLMAAVGLLVCDDDGRMSEATLKAAYADRSVLQAARALLEEARD